VVALTVLAVPLYLLRRPSPSLSSQPDAGTSTASATATVTATDAGLVTPERVRLGPVQRVRCGKSKNAKGKEGPACDAQPFFEQALAKAIVDNVDCAPREEQEGSINYVMQIDHAAKRVNVFSGASGSWKGQNAKRAAECVTRSLPHPPWETLPHVERYYMVAILATYPPAHLTIPGPPGAPSFQ